MPTARAWSFVAASFVFYMFANQTQIGWLYVVSALLAGMVLAGFVLSRRSVAGIMAERHLSKTESLHEGDDLTINLALNPRRRIPAVQLNLVERCPLADPAGDLHEITLFVPVLPAPDGLQFDYDLTVYRRGVYHFPPVKLSSRAPFGLYRRERSLPVTTSSLVYPQVKHLSRFPLLDRRIAAQLSYQRSGHGTEVIGVRPYRSGDSPRHIHWRSVARTGRLISKEFAEETQPGLTLVLDRYCPLTPLPETKHTPFEIAVKCAASIADYALRQQYPLYLNAASDDLAVPGGALSRDVLMQYLARVTPQPRAVLPDLLTHQPVQNYVAVIMAWTDDRIVEPLLALRQRGINIMVILPDPVTFPVQAADSADKTAAALRDSGLDVRIIRHGANLAQILSATEQNE